MQGVFSHILEQLNSIPAEHVVLRDIIHERKYTNEEFSVAVNFLSAYMKEHMAEEVLICADNSAELAILYFAGLFSGKVMIPIDPEKEVGEVERIKALHPQASFIDNSEAHKIVSAQVYTEEKSTRLLWERVDFDKLFLITYTSGSTGTPKGVRHTAGNLFVAAYEFGIMLKYGQHTVMGHCMPMTYMAGILNTIIMPYLMGGCIAILPRFSMKSAFSFWEDLRKGGVNTLWLSPTMLRIVNMMDKRATMKEYLHENNVKISVGTAPLDKSLRDEVEGKYGIRLYQSYGLSETLFISTEIPEERVQKHTVGCLLPGIKLKFSEDEEMQISVPWMFLGYTNEDTSLYMNDGFYLSGDLGRFDEDGNLVVVGRKKEVVVRGGYNINPRDIENKILEEKNVSECAVTSALIRGEEMIVCCYVADSEYSITDMNDMIVRALGKHSKIDFLERMRMLPKNLNGKVDKRVIAKMMGEQYDSKI
jgi:AMP-dependent synthetase/ligase